MHRHNWLVLILSVVFLLQITITWKSDRREIFDSQLDYKINEDNLILFTESSYTSVSLKFLSQIIWAPLIHLYLHGPIIRGYGFWQGKEMNEICQEITNVATRHWQLNPQECNDLVYRQVESFIVSTHISLVVILMIFLSYMIYCEYCYDVITDRFGRVLSSVNQYQGLLKDHNTKFVQ